MPVGNYIKRRASGIPLCRAPKPSSRQKPTWLLMGVLVAILLLPLSFLSTARRLTRLEFRLRELETEPERVASKRRHAAAEAARLTYLNRQLIDWADILAVTLHRSWGDPVEAAARAGSSRPTGVQAFVWGSTSLETARMHNEVMRLRRTLSRRGWATAVYADLLRAWQDAYPRAGGPWSANVDPSSDASQSPRPVVGLANGPELLRPRMDFHSAVVEERHIDAVRLRRIEVLRDAVGADASTLLGAVTSHVRPDGLPTPEFLASIIEPSPLPDFRDYVVHRVGGPSTSVELSIWSMSEQIRSTPPDDGVPRRRVATTAVPDRFVMASARMDLSAHLELSDTTLSAP